MGTGITWYDVVGALPGATTAEIRRSYEAKANVLRPELLTGTSSTVLTAASRAQGLIDSAWRVLGDPAQRAPYDEEAGIRTTGGGLVRRESVPSEPGYGPSDFDFFPGVRATKWMAALVLVADVMGPHDHQPMRVAVPDVQGLFFSVCSRILGRQGIRVTPVRLTERPMPVDGLVVSQKPDPLKKMRRGGALTVQVWHPPARR
jgi:hypothetical protein